jgi:uncharacterized protein (TIGR03000 family)
MITGKLLLRLFLPLPLMLTMAATEAKAQYGGLGLGIGVGSGFPGFGPGYGYGPYWGPGWFPGFYPGVFPGQMYGNYSNGMSMYGPPVPTYKPVPGMFGGGDSQFFPPPPAYRPGFYNFAYLPIHKPAPPLSPVLTAVPTTAPETLPPGIIAPEILPPPAVVPSVLTETIPLEIEIRMPDEYAQLFIDGEPTIAAGAVRTFKSPPFEATESHTYELKAVWTTSEGKITQTKKVTGRAGERLKVAFKN